MTHCLTEEWTRVDAYDHDIAECLTHSSRSPFYGADEQVLLLNLMKSEASFTQIDSRRASADPAYGYVLFRHLQRQKNVYIPIHGPIHFFTPYRRSGRLPEAAARETSRRPLKRYQAITLEELRSHYRYMGSLWSGQIAGLVELIQNILMDVTVSGPTAERDRRRAALRDTHLPDLAGRWLSYGCAPTGARVLRIPYAAMNARFFEHHADTQLLFPKRERAWEIVSRRCYEELAFRQAEYLSYTALLSKQKRAAVFSMQLFAHHKRSKTSKLDSTNEEIMWMLGEYNSREATALRHEVLDLAGGNSVGREGSAWLIRQPEALKSAYTHALVEEMEREQAL